MSKRTKLILLIIFVLCLFGIGIYFLIQPILENRTVEQPPSLPSSATPALPKTKPRPAPGEVSTSTVPQVVLDTSARLRMLETKAMTVTERVYSGSNSDGFTGYEDVAADFSPAGSNWLRSEQLTMRNAHPANGPAYGISARSVSSKLDTEAKWGDPQIVVTVQAILRQDGGGQSAKKIVWRFEKQADDTYLLSAPTVSDLPL